MVQLSTFKRDSSVFDTGEWIAVGDEYGDLEILTRGFNDEYADMRNALMRKAAIAFRGDVTKVTTAATRAVTIDCLIAKCIVDVRNLTDDNGQPVGVKDFAAFLRNPDFSDLYTATLNACSLVGRAKAEDTKADLKN